MLSRMRNPHPTLPAVALVAALGLVAVAMTPAIEGDNVAVVINDNSVDMPDSLKAGPTTFEITNRGTERHSLAIAREAGEADADLDAELGPGETATLEYELKEGRYLVYCPMDDHKETLSHRLTVWAEKVPND